MVDFGQRVNMKSSKIVAALERRQHTLYIYIKLKTAWAFARVSTHTRTHAHRHKYTNTHHMHAITDQNSFTHIPNETP